jgi:hypothetical protein
MEFRGTQVAHSPPPHTGADVRKSSPPGGQETGSGAVSETRLPRALRTLRLSLRALRLKGLKPQSAPRISLRAQRQPPDKLKLQHHRDSSTAVPKGRLKTTAFRQSLKRWPIRNASFSKGLMLPSRGCARGLSRMEAKSVYLNCLTSKTHHQEHRAPSRLRRSTPGARRVLHWDAVPANSERTSATKAFIT